MAPSKTNHITHRRGISMAETILASLVIGFVLVATLQIVGPMVRSTTLQADRIVASNLANELAEEILSQQFQDPDTSDPDLIGVDDAERADQRADFDDIDDYHGWASSPPKLSNNQSNVFLPGWERSVKVTHVEVADPSTTSAAYTGLKSITIIVKKDGIEHARLVLLQSNQADQVGFIVSAGGGG